MELVEYIRGNKNKKIGIMVSFIRDDKLVIGFSKCNKKDEFDKERGLQIARERAIIWNKFYDSDKEYKIPKSCEDQFIKFVNRTLRYFKYSVLPNWLRSQTDIINGVFK